jgi:hypothetical protein
MVCRCLIEAGRGLAGSYMILKYREWRYIKTTDENIFLNDLTPPNGGPIGVSSSPRGRGTGRDRGDADGDGAKPDLADPRGGGGGGGGLFAPAF